MHRLTFFVILASAIVLRVMRVSHAVVVAPDSPAYIHDALSIGTDGLRSLFLDGFGGNFSIYPVALYLVNLLVKNPVFSGQLISLFFGCLLIVPVYFLVKEIMGTRAGLCAAFLAAVHPHLIRYSGEVLKDSMLFFFAIASVALALAGHERKKYLLIFLAGVGAWTAGLVRVYGVVIVVSVSVAIVVSGLADRRKWHETARELLLFAVPVPVVGYFLFILFLGTGNEYITRTVVNLLLIITRKFSVVGSYRDILIANNPGVDPQYLDVITSYPWFSAAGEFLEVLIETSLIVLCVLFPIGVYLDRASLLKRGPGPFVMTCAAVLTLIDILIVMTLFFLSKRHVMILVILLLPWSALAFSRIIQWCREQARKKCRINAAGFRGILSAFFAGSVILTLVFTSFLDREIDRRYYKREAGEYIRNMGQSKPLLVIPPSDKLVIFYSGGTQIILDDPETLEKTIAETKPDFVFWDTDTGPLPRSFSTLLERGIIEQVRMFQGMDNYFIVIYRIGKD